jgi:hypothetical protein
MRAISLNRNFGKRAHHTTSLDKSIAARAMCGFQQNANSLAFKQRAILNVFEPGGKQKFSENSCDDLSKVRRDREVTGRKYSRRTMTAFGRLPATGDIRAT